MLLSDDWAALLQGDQEDMLTVLIECEGFLFFVSHSSMLSEKCSSIPLPLRPRLPKLQNCASMSEFSLAMRDC